MALSHLHWHLDFEHLPHRRYWTVKREKNQSAPPIYPHSFKPGKSRSITGTEGREGGKGEQDGVPPHPLPLCYGNQGQIWPERGSSFKFASFVWNWKWDWPAVAGRTRIHVTLSMSEQGKQRAGLRGHWFRKKSIFYLHLTEYSAFWYMNFLWINLLTFEKQKGVKHAKISDVLHLVGWYQSNKNIRQKLLFTE